MSQYAGPPDRDNDPDPDAPGPWTYRVTFSETPEGLPFAYRPHEVITTHWREAIEVARELFERDEEYYPERGDEENVGHFTLLAGIRDPILLVDELRLRGIVAQPNHVYFAHSLGGNPIYGHGVNGDPLSGSPIYGHPVSGYPIYGHPIYGHPVYGTGFFGSPIYGHPIYGHPFGFSGKPGLRAHIAPDRSTALPPPRHTDVTDAAARVGTDLAAGSPHVIVLDTGLAAPGPNRPAGLGSGIAEASATDIDHPDEDLDTYLDPVAGHGTFIAGVIAQIAPGCEITVHRVLKTSGDGDEWKIAKRIYHLVTPEPKRTILSLSFGGYTLERPHLMAWVIRRIQNEKVTVVASAGNDATWRPSFPAALPEVVAVGALSPDGPAWFTNYGDWVDACAPGADLVSTFFVFNGPAPVGPYGDDPDDFKGWAQWSGTSFSAPVVVGNLAQMMMTGTATGADAVKRLIAAPSLTAIPGLGTVVDFL